MHDIRRLDALGRIGIPKWMRTHLQIPTATQFGIALQPTGEIILKPIPQSCRICGSEENLHYWEEKEIHLCSSCCERLEITLSRPLKKVRAHGMGVYVYPHLGE